MASSSFRKNILSKPLCLYILPVNIRQPISLHFKSWFIEKGYCCSTAVFGEQWKLEWRIAKAVNP
jgi:hypothetical protein